ncbi:MULTISPECIES: hypothetical protein [unclassified Vibrio]|uniref:hypothetical protein n=1 Tax=unclassified Vibrio TaxID=2614977 RepID=UPI001361D6B6|nr:MULTISPECIES: hypothetical protein [unclassified Vibrio]NAW57472.1 hypothetical protein [Vibrio sp. V36_P2S2PM302]NAX27159.1 hypothetical protein [Vibrio sp. V38_P2S17PM301]NAX32390.1 hypothetical protein [Vibrio sp. V37_P2S8PM304]
MSYWRINKSAVRWSRPISSAAQRNFDLFQNEIFHNGTDPRHAADEFDSHVECLDKGNNVWSIRLSQRDRVVFRLDETDHVCIIEGVGGHY